MGQSTRPKPTRLAEKLVDVRLKLGLSQNELISRMGLTGEITQARISAYERGVREPPLAVLLSYARIAGICMEGLVDDDLDLPEKLPDRSGHGIGVRSRRRTKSLNSK
jgi:transcriptional regulator with XRE-family HTH domain